MPTDKAQQKAEDSDSYQRLTYGTRPDTKATRILVDYCSTGLSVSKQQDIFEPLFTTKYKQPGLASLPPSGCMLALAATMPSNKR